MKKAVENIISYNFYSNFFPLLAITWVLQSVTVNFIDNTSMKNCTNLLFASFCALNFQISTFPTVLTQLVVNLLNCIKLKVILFCKLLLNKSIYKNIIGWICSMSIKDFDSSQIIVHINSKGFSRIWSLVVSQLAITLKSDPSKIKRSKDCAPKASSYIEPPRITYFFFK